MRTHRLHPDLNDDEHERDVALLKLLPRHELILRAATRQAIELEARGLALEEIEARLFDGLPRDAGWRAVRRRERDVGYERCGIGTKALLAGQLTALDIAEPRARMVAEQKRVEADALARAQVERMLTAAGWPREDL